MDIAHTTANVILRTFSPSFYQFYKYSRKKPGLVWTAANMQEP